jgi:hypothetical protein
MDLDVNSLYPHQIMSTYPHTIEFTLLEDKMQRLPYGVRFQTINSVAEEMEKWAKSQFGDKAHMNTWNGFSFPQRRDLWFKTKGHRDLFLLKYA